MILQIRREFYSLKYQILLNQLNFFLLCVELGLVVKATKQA